MTVLLCLPLVIGSGSPAVALTCAPPIGTPDELVASDWFFEDYDFAVVGTVRAIATNEDGNSPEYGRTRNTIDVAVVFGESTARDSMSVTTSDPGWLQGYGFVVGKSYFIPVQTTGPLGEHNYSFSCDPIHELADVEALVPLLISEAGAAGVPVALPGDGSNRVAMPLTIAALASSLIVGAAYTFSRRRKIDQPL